MMIRRTITALLVALVASFALSSPASAATKKTAKPRVRHSTHAAATAKTKPAVKKKKGVKKKTARSSTTAKQSGKTQKRKPTTKPH
jgi:hypothetical protein